MNDNERKKIGFWATLAVSLIIIGGTFGVFFTDRANFRSDIENNKARIEQIEQKQESVSRELMDIKIDVAESKVILKNIEKTVSKLDEDKRDGK